MKIIGAGFGRTGTLSLKSALEELGFGPCYHMRIALTHPRHMKFWVDAKARMPVDWGEFFLNYQATIDWPACEFYQELIMVYPDAKVLLNVRDPDEWYESMYQTVYKIQNVFPTWFPRIMVKMQDDIIWQGRFEGTFEDRQRAIDIFKQHIDEVSRIVPPDRLLVYDVKQGWEPLCQFLNVPIPKDKAFPHLNEAAEYKKLIKVIRIIRWFVPFLGLVLSLLVVYVIVSLLIS